MEEVVTAGIAPRKRKKEKCSKIYRESLWPDKKTKKKDMEAAS